MSTDTQNWPGQAGFFEAHGLEEIELLLCGFAGSVECAIADMGSVLLMRAKKVQSGARAGGMSFGPSGVCA